MVNAKGESTSEAGLGSWTVLCATMAVLPLARPCSRAIFMPATRKAADGAAWTVGFRMGSALAMEAMTWSACFHALASWRPREAMTSLIHRQLACASPVGGNT